MAGDFNKPALTDLYTDVLTEIRDMFADQAKQFDGTTTTNYPTNTVRWSSSSNKWQKYNGSTWADLTSGYAIPISGGTINNSVIGGTTAAAGTFTTLTATGNATLGDAEATDTHSIKGATTVLTNSSSPALKITQTGAGYALLVEDSASTDSTPFVITDDGIVGIGAAPSVANKLQVFDTIADATSYSGYWQVNMSNPSGAGSTIGFQVLAVPTTSWGSTGTPIAMLSGVTNQNAGTIANIRNFSANYTTTGGGTVTNRFGFYDGGLALTSGSVGSNYSYYAHTLNVGATTNYGFACANISSGGGSTSYGFHSNVNTGAGTNWNFYAAGTADNYFAGNLAFASGKGIDFSATANGSGTVTSEVFDDYETGTWTPVISAATVGNLSVSYSTQRGRYTKIGRMVIAECSIVTSAFTHSTASGGFRITGLPFTSATTPSQTGPAALGGYTKANYTNSVSVVTSSTAIGNFYLSGSAQAVATAAITDFPTGGTVEIRAQFIYEG